MTWDKVGNAVADATYGGYVIVTGALFIGKLTGDLPTMKRITEIVLLLVGALFYVVLGTYTFATVTLIKSITPMYVFVRRKFGVRLFGIDPAGTGGQRGRSGHVVADHGRSVSARLGRT